MHDDNKLRILILEPRGYSNRSRAILESFANVDDGPLSRETLIERIKDYDVLIVRLGHRIDAEVMDASPRLKAVVSATTGLNHIDIEAANKCGVAVLTLRGERGFLDNIHATAEHTWELLLALTRKLLYAHEHVIMGGWDRDRFKGMELYGRTLRIIGLGRLGIKVADYGLAFGMRVIGHDIKRAQALPKGVELVSLHQVLKRSDVVSIHVNYTMENHSMISKVELSQMKKGSLLINSSRGELIDEIVLLEMIESGHIGGAALDVLCGENIGWDHSDRLINYARRNENLILTPHIGGCTYESMEKTEIFMAEKLLKHFKRDS